MRCTHAIVYGWLRFAYVCGGYYIWMWCANSRLIGKSKGMKQLLMEVGKWAPTLKTKCKPPRHEDSHAAARTKHTHTIDCCQYGRLLHITDSKKTRLEDTHLARMVKMANYKIMFIPKYHCGSYVAILAGNMLCIWWQVIYFEHVSSRNIDNCLPFYIILSKRVGSNWKNLEIYEVCNTWALSAHTAITERTHPISHSFCD